MDTHATFSPKGMVAKPVEVEAATEVDFWTGFFCRESLFAKPVRPFSARRGP
jgi:hypothetical protein